MILGGNRGRKVVVSQAEGLALACFLSLAFSLQVLCRFCRDATVLGQKIHRQRSKKSFSMLDRTERKIDPSSCHFQTVRCHLTARRAPFLNGTGDSDNFKGTDRLTNTSYLWHECKEGAADGYSSTSKGIRSRNSLLCLDAASFAPRLSFGHWRIFFVASVDETTTTPSPHTSSSRGTTMMSSSSTSSSSTTTFDAHPIGLGTFMMDRDQEVGTALQSAIAAGYRRIDCAPVYFNEDAVGDALAAMITTAVDDAPGIAARVVSRQELFVVSKLASPFHRNVEAAVRKTLLDLRLDYLDLYLGTYVIIRRQKDGVESSSCAR